MKESKIIFIQPKPLFAAAAILLVLFAGFILFEYRKARQDILAMMTEEGYVLLDALAVSGERSVIGLEEVQKQIIKLLVGNARLIAQLDEIHTLGSKDLERLASSLNLDRILLINRTGRWKLSNTLKSQTVLTQNETDWLTPIFAQKQDSVVRGFFDKAQDGQSDIHVAIRHPGGGAVMVALDAERLSMLRREIDPGRLVQEIGRQPEVAYVALQDTISIILASRQIRSLGRILSDPFLTRIWKTKQRDARQMPFEGRRILEISGPFIIGGETLGLFRIGFEMTYFRHIIQNAKIRLTLLGIFLIVSGFLGMVFWVTRQNARLVQHAFDRFKTQSGEILEHLEDAVVATNSAGVITAFNQAAETLFQSPREQVLGKSIHFLSNVCFEALRETLNRGEARQEADARCRIGNEERALFLRTSITKAESGEVDAAILIATDFTERRRLEWEVRQKEKLQALGKLASEVAHEVRNPINAIGMIAQRFRKEFRPSSRKAEYDALIEVILKEVSRTNRIIQQFLQFARTKPPEFQTIETVKFIRDLAVLFYSSAQSKGVFFDTPAIHDVHLKMDPEQMKQALLNLLQNALEACGQGGRIALSGVCKNKEYWISVRDDGVGIAREKREHIFELYYTTKSGGTGLGLPVVYQIVQNHRGVVDFESAEGEGAVFHVRLPLT